MKRIALFLFCILFFCLCTFFSAGLLFAGNKPDLSEFPVMLKEDGISDTFSTDLEEWFSKNFACSDVLSDWFTGLKCTLLREGTDQVIVGENGFLFFADTVPDYTGLSAMSDDAVNQTAEALLDLQNTVQANGADFLFICAPNKNTIYGDQMPARYLSSEKESNMDRLYRVLDTLGVRYTDVRPILSESASDELVYHKTDTHWNGLGARLAVETMLADCGIEMPDLEGRGPVVCEDFQGDLTALLYRTRKVYDRDVTYDFSGLYGFTSAYSTPMDMIITTRGGGEKKLLMFRDSFANACIPYLASAFAETHLERAVPYRTNLLKTFEPDLVIVEIAERNLPVLLSQILQED